jgi:hypothetical protein
MEITVISKAAGEISSKELMTAWRIEEKVFSSFS